jgi:hypothetical protein
VDDKRLLLFLTDDTPFEEMLNIALIDLDDGVKEILTLGGAYLTGSFADLHIAPNAVEFSFIGETTWRVEIPASPFVKVPFTGDPRGVSRSVAVKHYIKITANPAPACRRSSLKIPPSRYSRMAVQAHPGYTCLIRA